MHKTSFRTHTCADLRKENNNQDTVLCGWVMRQRDHGGLIFIDLRDRFGITQIVLDPKMAEGIKIESVIQVSGKVEPRPEGMVNTKMETGEIEVVGKEVKILSTSKTPPFEIDSDKDVNEELRLEYRYLDIRRERMKRNLVVRHKLIKFIRDFLDEKDFTEIETPVLIKGTPEGSREYIVPSRLYPGKFFVLPQSPQQLKQLLMVAGMDRYFQIVKCFRDEDQRGDRQPEFTQLDLEMSFVEAEDIISLNEEMMLAVMKKFAPNKKIQASPLPRITWKDAMDKYGSDKPDLRFGMEIFDLTDAMEKSEFKVFNSAKASGNIIRGLTIKKGTELSRSEYDGLEETAKSLGAHGLIWMLFGEEVKSPIAKFLKPEEIEKIKEVSGAQKGDSVIICAAPFKICCDVLGNLRLKIADKQNLRDKNKFALCWVTEFPMFELNVEENRLDAQHHPFTSPMDEDAELLNSTPEKARSKAYDLVLNGVELGGGSVRIHKSDIQSKIFDILKISREDATLRFGHMLRAFEYGPPPHGGIAWGLDRLLMMILDEPNIREVIAFPKDQKAKDLMTGAPSEIPEIQVAEMNVKVISPKS